MTKKMASIAATPDDQEKQEVFNMLIAGMTNVEMQSNRSYIYTSISLSNCF